MKKNHLVLLTLGILGATAAMLTLPVLRGSSFPDPSEAKLRTEFGNAGSPVSLKHQLETFRALLDVTESVTGESEIGPENSQSVAVDRHIPGNIAFTTLPDGRRATYDRLTGEITGWDTYNPEEAKLFGFDFDFRRSDYATYSLETLQALADADDHIAMMYVAEVRARERDYDEAKRLWITSATLSGQTRGLGNAAAHFFGRRDFFQAYVFGSLGGRLGDQYVREYAGGAAGLLTEDEIRVAEAEAERIFRAMEEDRLIRTGHGF